MCHNSIDPVNAFHYSPADLEKMDAATLRRELHVAQLKILWLEEQLRLERIKKYGRSSEKLNDAQLALLEEEPGVSSAEVEAESRREPVEERPSGAASGGIRGGRRCRRTCRAWSG